MILNMAALSITITRPDDWHVHIRDGAMLRSVLPCTARQFARAVVMPNIKPPVVSVARVREYRAEIMAALPAGSAFSPLMTLYLTDNTDAEDLARGYEAGEVFAAKLYPANATTNSEHGVTNVNKIHAVLEKMQRIGMPLLVHGEVTDPEIDIFDREAVFVSRVLMGLRKDFPALKIVFEHVTTRQAVDYIADEGKSGKLAATVTAHHLLINRNAVLAGGIRPHNYCLPVAKREVHRQALVRAVTSGDKMFFPGTDSAPHSRSAKESDCGCAGIFTAANALELYAQVFSEAGALANFEKFMSRNGPVFHGLPINDGVVKLEQSSATDNRGLPAITVVSGDNIEEVVPFQPPSAILWRMVA